LSAPFYDALTFWLCLISFIAAIRSFYFICVHLLFLVISFPAIAAIAIALLVVNYFPHGAKQRLGKAFAPIDFKRVISTATVKAIVSLTHGEWGKDENGRGAR